MKKLIVSSIAMLLLTAAGAGCSKKESAGQEKPPVAVEMAVAVTVDIQEGVDVVGSLDAKYSSDVKSEVTGRVSAVLVNEWVRVKKGTPLLRLDTQEQDAIARRAGANAESAKAGVLEAEAAAQRAEREHERAQNLLKSGLATRQQMDDAVTARDAARARVEASKAQQRAAEEDAHYARTRVTKSVVASPLNGVVAMRAVNAGDVVDPMIGKTLFKIVDNTILNLTVTVPSKSMASVKVGQPLEFSVDAWPGRNFTGRVMYINPSVEEADRSVKVIAEVMNSGGELKSGLFVKGRILTAKRQKVLLVPRSALVGWNTGEKKAVVFAVAADGKAKQKAVVTGATEGELVEIGSGLAAGEKVVTRGVMNVRDGDRLLAAPAATETGKGK